MTTRDSDRIRGSGYLVGAFYRAETADLKNVPIWKNYRFLSVALLFLTTSLVWNFR